MEEEEIFNLFELDESSNKRDVRVGYIDPDLGYVKNISRYQANKYAELNPGTQFIVSNRDEVRYLNINEVNKLDLNKTTPAERGGSCGSGTSLASVSFDLTDVDKDKCSTRKDRISVDFIGGGGVGAQANPIILNGSLVGIDLEHGGFGYKYPPLVQITDNCDIGKGATAVSVLGETATTLESYNDPEDFENLDFRFGFDEGINFPEIFGSRYNEDAIVIGDWSPSDYANFREDQIASEIKKYQEFLKFDRKNWWTTRTSKPDKVTVAGGTGKKSLYNVSHWSWGGELIKPEPITGFVEVPFDIRNVDNSYTKLGIKLEFESEDGSHRFRLDPNFSEFADNTEEEEEVTFSDVKLRFIEEDEEYFILATGKGRAEVEIVFTSKDASTAGYAFLTEYDLEEEPDGSRSGSPPIRPLTIQTDDGELEWFKSLNKTDRTNTKTGLFTAGERYRINAPYTRVKPQRGRDPIELKLPIVTKEQISYLDNDGNDANASLTFGNYTQRRLDDPRISPGVLQYERVLVKKVKANTTYKVRSLNDRFQIKNEDKIIKSGIIDKEDGEVKVSGEGLGSITFTTYVEKKQVSEDTTVLASRGIFLAKAKTKSSGKTRYDFVYRLDLPDFRTREEIIIDDTFMNTHAVSPVPRSDVPRSANVGKEYTIEWRQYFPYTGKYKFRGIADTFGTLNVTKDGAARAVQGLDDWPLEQIKGLYRNVKNPKEITATIEEGTYTIGIALKNAGPNSYSALGDTRLETIWDSAKHKNRATNKNLNKKNLYRVNPSNKKDADFINEFGVSPVAPSTVKRDAGRLAEDVEERLGAKFIYENDKVYLKVTGEGRVRVALRLKVNDNPDVAGLAITEARIECDGGEPIRIIRGKDGDGEYQKEYTKYGAGEFTSGKKYRVRLSGGGRDSGIGVRERNKIGIDDNISNGYDENAELEITSVKILESPTPIITTDKYAGEYDFQWNNLKINQDGTYIFAMEADGSALVEISDQKGSRQDKNKFKKTFRISEYQRETITLVKGDYRISVSLLQEKGKKIRDFNALKFGLKVTTLLSTISEIKLNNQSWDENPFGVALTIEAPEPPVPQLEENPIQIGRCANNPLWTTRFTGADSRWYPVFNGKNDGIAGGRDKDVDTDRKILGYDPDGKNNKVWSDFTNRYAISPIKPSGKESSSRLLNAAQGTNTWEVMIPYNGTYGVQGTFSGKSGKITLSGAPVPGGLQTFDLQPSNVGYLDEGSTIRKIKTNTIQLTGNGEGRRSRLNVKVEVEQDTAPGQKTVESKIFDAADWIDKIKDVTGEPIEEKILCHAGGGFGGRKNEKQDKVGRVLVGSGGNGGPGQSDEERGGAANGGGAGLRNGRSARSGKGDTLDGGFGVSFDGYEIGTDDEVRSGGDDTRIFTGGRLGQPSDDGGKGAFHGGGGGGSRGGGTGGSGGGGGVRITWGSTGKSLEFNAPGTYTAIVPRSSPGRDDVTQVRMICIGGGGSGHTDKSPGIKESEKTGTAEFTVPVVTPFNYETEYGTEYGVEVRNELKKVEVYQEIRKVSGGGGSGGAYAYQNVKLPAGAVIQIVVGAGGRAQATGGSQDGEGSYVRVLRTTLKPEFVSIDNRTGTILNGEVIEKRIPEKYEGVTYKGPPIASYTKLISSSGRTDRNRGEQAFANKMGALISPFLPLGRLDTTVNGKVSEFVWKDVDFPVTDSYIFESVADESMEVFIGDATDKDNRVMRVSIEEGVKRVVRKVDRGRKKITLILSNSNQDGTNYNLNPMYAGFKIYREVIVDDVDKRSWRQNPIGVSAVIIPPPCEKEVGGVGVVTDVIITNPGIGYTNPPGTTYPVGLVIKDIDIIDPGTNYKTGDPIELIFPDIDPITIVPFYIGTPPGVGRTTGIGTIPGIGVTTGIDTFLPGRSTGQPPGTPPTGGGEPIVPPGGDPPPDPFIIPPDPEVPPDGGGEPGSPPGGRGDQFGPPNDGFFGPAGSLGTPGDPQDGGGEPGSPPGGGGDPFSPSPEFPLNLKIEVDPFGRFTNIEVVPFPFPPFIPKEIPKIRVLSQTGINAVLRPRIGVIRDPLGIPPESIIQVTDLVGIKQTGYIDGRPYYGQVFTIQGIKYAGVYGTVGELIQVYDTLQESITRQVTTPPSAIIRQGTDINSNDPRLNIPGTPETIE